MPEPRAREVMDAMVSAIDDVGNAVGKLGDVLVDVAECVASMEDRLDATPGKEADVMDALQCVYAAGHEGPCLYGKDCAVSGERCNHHGYDDGEPGRRGEQMELPLKERT